MKLQTNNHLFKKQKTLVLSYFSLRLKEDELKMLEYLLYLEREITAHEYEK